MALHSNTPFNIQGQEGTSPFYRASIVGGLSLGAFVGHKALLANNPNYSMGLYRFLQQVEDKTPNVMFRTFALSELMSSYTLGDIFVHRTSLVNRSGLTELGQHFQRLMGDRIDILRDAEAGLKFQRISASSPYHQLISDFGGSESNVRIRFTERGRLSGSSFRYGASLNAIPRRNANGLIDKIHSILETQRPTGYAGFVGESIQDPTKIGAVSRLFQPWVADFKGSPVESFLGKANRIAFELVERPQRLLADVGLGLRRGTYNKVLSLPFSTKSSGLINEVLSKRILPIYLGGFVALPYLDYLSGHALSDFAINVFQSLNITRAKLTDNIPGARETTDLYKNIVPGPQYGPLALPIGGAFVGGLYHYGKVLANKFPTYASRMDSGRVFAADTDETIFRILNKKSPITKGLLAGLALMLPFIPGMLGSRKSANELEDIYSGDELVPIRSGRWWDLGTTPFEGSRIKEWRPHWSVLWKAQSEKASLYGSEEEYWKHHPILHPINYIEDPYYLEKLHYEDRPYPIASPAFSGVPLIGPILAATIGKVIKPPLLMHVGEWEPDKYTLYSTRLEPRGPDQLPPPTAKPEFSLGHSLHSEPGIFAEFVGLPGFIASTIYGKVFPDVNKGKDVYLEGSRQMESLSRRYYDLELGAGMFASPKGDISLVGYSEPFRRFVQREQGIADANEIPNTMPYWIPGDDYFVNLRVGDPYSKISDGYARLPGPGYESLHPELAGVPLDEYPDINKLAILADVAPYSKEYQMIKGKVAKGIGNNTSLRIEYEKIVERNRKMRESVVDTDLRRFSEDIETATGTIKNLEGKRFELEQFPGRKFSLSGVGFSAADLSAMVLSENNDLTKSQVASEVDRRIERLNNFLQSTLSEGTNVRITVPRGALVHSLDIQAVVDINGETLNKELIDEGLAKFDKNNSGAELQAMFGPLARRFGALAESASFTGDESFFNPLRYVPQPFNTKLWQQREPLSQYREQEASGARMRRWQRPIHDFLAAYGRGVIHRLSGETLIPEDVIHRRELNTTVDMLQYLRALNLSTTSPEDKGRYTSQARRTAIGSDLFSSPVWIGSTLPEREAHYFRRFLSETDDKKRLDILDVVPEETAEALMAQWAMRDAKIAEAEDRNVPNIGEGGRLFTQKNLEDYNKAHTSLDYGDYVRSKQIAQFFVDKGLNLPDSDSELWNPDLDYEDVKLKILQLEGYDAHDFNIFDDRVALLWRKPYVDGAVRELTSGSNKSTEQVRQAVERLILAAKDKNPKVVATGSSSYSGRNNLRLDVELDQKKDLLQDMRRNPEKYQEES